MGERDEVPITLDLIYRFHHSPQSLLEIACGTGKLLEGFSDHFRCEGLDLSMAMIREARRRLPEAKFYDGDMTQFHIPKKFDVVVCLFNSLNHLLHFSEWKSTFRCVKEHLNPGGLFIFDINTEYALSEFDRYGDLVESHDEGTTAIEYTLERDKSLRMDVKFFSKLAGREKGHYRLYETIIRERSFPLPKVKEALLKDFASVRFFDRDRARVTTKSEVVYCVAFG